MKIQMLRQSRIFFLKHTLSEGEGGSNMFLNTESSKEW